MHHLLQKFARHVIVVFVLTINHFQFRFLFTKSIILVHHHSDRMHALMLAYYAIASDVFQKKLL